MWRKVAINGSNGRLTLQSAVAPDVEGKKYYVNVSAALAGHTTDVIAIEVEVKSGTLPTGAIFMLK